MSAFLVGLAVGVPLGLAGGWTVARRYQRMVGRMYRRLQNQLMGGGKQK